jgi:xanthine dehydrogenase accessory factor
VSGGCVESAAAVEVAEAIGRGTPKLVTYGVSDERAWEVGLACGGTIRVFVEPTIRPEVLEAARGPGGVVVATVLEGAGAGSALVMRDDGTERGSLPAGIDRGAVADAARRALAVAASSTMELPGPGGTARVFLEVFARRPTLVIFGGVHIAAALVPLAKALGYRTVVADGREAFLSRERFPDADELVLGWPEEAFARVGIDAATYVCVLSHDPKFDEPALEIALRSKAAYVGAIGSRKTQTARRERLRAAGFGEAELARLRGPIGLDLGGRQPVETALAILAEITAARYGGSGGPLTAK